MKIIVIGEIIVDKYYYTNTDRTAPEINIPVYLTNNNENKLGGASNVALNLKNKCDIEFISVIGNDEYNNLIRIIANFFQIYLR